MSERAEPLTKAEQTLRARFVEEYLVDYDAFAACLRLGYLDQFADTYAKRFMVEPYTRQLISKREAELGLDSEEKQHRKRIVAGLYREAHSRFNTGSARVAALTQLAKITGIEAPVKTELKVEGETQDLSALDTSELKQLQGLLSKANANRTTH